jgi:two-component system chemotaxis sensor kinase CheA
MSDQVSDSDGMKEIIDEFVVEAGELVEKAIQEVVTIEDNPDEEVINSIFRAVHTIKGTSSFLGFGMLSTLAHRSEDLLGMVRKRSLEPGHEIADVLLEALDLIKTLLEDIRDGGVEAANITATVTKLEKLASPETKKLGEILVEEGILKGNELNDALKKQRGQQKDKKLGEILVEEKLITEGQLKEVLTKQKTLKEEQTIRIEVRKLDELMNLAGELVIGKNRLVLLNELVRKHDRGGDLEGLADIANYIEVITNKLQLSVMRARLVPIGKLFNKMPRLVRDLSVEFRKEVDLKTEGEGTELDRSLIESLHDPLIHIMRNSVDHGIEAPEDRERGGKQRRGAISLRAHNEGNNVIIEIFDDGKGINVEEVSNKARERRLMTENEMKSLSSRDAMNLVFVPGLSTAKRLSSVSGRGVGMDVVKTNIEKVNGQVSIDSEEGQWTKLTLRLPLTVAIMRALIVRILDELFAIPLNTVTELVKRESGVIKSVDMREVLVLRDRVIPVVDLARTFCRRNSDGEDKYIVICKVGEKTIGIRTSGVEGQEEVVIKPLGEFLGNIKGIGGATIRGDGRAILILDMSALIDVAGDIATQNIYRRTVQNRPQ